MTCEVRRAVRVVLIDPADRLLLLWHSRPQDDDHWAPPGGGVEAGEGLPQAAARELKEEVGLTEVVLSRPVWVWQHRFSYHGTPIVQHETIFAARLQRSEEARGSAHHVAADGIADARWWSTADLAQCRDDVWPHGLSELAPGLLASDLNPTRPRYLRHR